MSILGKFIDPMYSKKKNSIALSTAEAEYIAVGACCSQILWIAQQLRDLGIYLKAFQSYVIIQVQFLLLKI